MSEIGYGGDRQRPVTSLASMEVSRSLFRSYHPPRGGLSRRSFQSLQQQQQKGDRGRCGPSQRGSLRAIRYSRATQLITFMRSEACVGPRELKSIPGLKSRRTGKPGKGRVLRLPGCVAGPPAADRRSLARTGSTQL